MFKKISTLQLLIVFAILIACYFALDYFTGSQRSSSFRDELVTIDTANISKIVVTTKSNPGEDIVLIKTNNSWYIRLKEGKTVAADKDEVKRAIDVLTQVKPKRLAANDPSKFSEFQVDTTGTRVKVFEGDEKTLDIIIGKFSFQNKREFYTYVRLADENEVYTTDAFLGPSFQKELSRWRYQTVLKLVPDSVINIAWTYPADSSFTLSKTLTKNWSVNGEPADSASVMNFLNAFRNLYSDKFADDVSKTNLSNKVFTIVIKLSNSEKIEINAYWHPTYKWIINSSLNPKSYFASDDQGIIKKLFTGKEIFMVEDKIF